MDVLTIDEVLGRFLAENYTPDRVEQLADQFHRTGFVKFDEHMRLVPDALVTAVRVEADRLLEERRERRDLVLGTTGSTPRNLSVVRSEEVGRSGLIRAVAGSRVLRTFLEGITREPIMTDVSDDERYLITHQEFASDTHGWHWDDYSFALNWALRMPPVACGGMVQTVPHTHWNKSDPRINETLCERQIDTHGLTTGDLYLLRSDTSMHRTVPLTEDGAVRTMLVVTWAGERDLGKELIGDDRWWDNPEVDAARSLDRA
ncbi:ArpA protein [Streptomyces olivoreticuli]